MKKIKKTKRSTCRHEAGHILVATVVGFFPVLGAEVSRNGREWTGEVTLATSGGVLERTMAWKGLKVVIAGVLAENPDLKSSEIEAALPAFDQLKFWASVQVAADGNNDEALLAEATETTKNILNEHRWALDEITTVLFRRGKIDGNEIREIIEA